MASGKSSKKREYVLEVIIIVLLILLTGVSALAQNVGINATGAAPDGSALLDVASTTKGVLVPRMTQTQRNAITTPATGLLIFQTDNTPGFYYYNGTAWVPLSGGGTGWLTTGNTGMVSGTNFLGTLDSQHLDIRTYGGLRARFTTKGQIETLNTGQSVFVGEGAGASDNLSNNRNVFMGYLAGNSNSSGYANVYVGKEAGKSGTSANSCIAIGAEALENNSFGNANIALGWGTMKDNGSGGSNVAIGNFVLGNNTTGSDNVAIGPGMMYSSTTASRNVSIGTSALQTVTKANENVGVGYFALQGDSVGGFNTALGARALQLTTGYGNIGVGHEAGRNLTTGNRNIVIGEDVYAPVATASNQLNIGNIIYGTGVDGVFNTVSGGRIGIAVTTPAEKLDVNGAIRVGVAAGTNAGTIQWTGADFQGYNGSAWVSLTGAGDTDWTKSGTRVYNTTDSVGIGTTTPAVPFDVRGDVSILPSSSTVAFDFFNTIFTEPTMAPATTNYGYVGTASQIVYRGHFGGLTYYGGGLTNGSDRRLKENIQPMTSTIDKIQALKPVTYDYKADFFSDPSMSDEKLAQVEADRKDQLGLIAQELETVFPELVKPIDGTDYKGVNYVGLVPVLIKGMQEQQAMIEQLQSEINTLKSNNE